MSGQVRDCGSYLHWIAPSGTRQAGMSTCLLKDGDIHKHIALISFTKFVLSHNCMMTLAAEAGVSGRDKQLHPTNTLWYAITYPCWRYPILAPKSSYTNAQKCFCSITHRHSTKCISAKLFQSSREFTGRWRNGGTLERSSKLNSTSWGTVHREWDNSYAYVLIMWLCTIYMIAEDQWRFAFSWQPVYILLLWISPSVFCHPWPSLIMTRSSRKRKQASAAGSPPATVAAKRRHTGGLPIDIDEFGAAMLEVLNKPEVRAAYIEMMDTSNSKTCRRSEKEDRILGGWGRNPPVGKRAGWDRDPGPSTVHTEKCPLYT